MVNGYQGNNTNISAHSYWICCCCCFVQLLLFISKWRELLRVIFSIYYIHFFLLFLFLFSPFFSFCFVFGLLRKLQARKKKQQKTSNNVNELTHSTSQPNKQCFILLLFFFLENCMHILQSYSHGYIETHKKKTKKSITILQHTLRSMLTTFSSWYLLKTMSYFCKARKTMRREKKTIEHFQA